MKEQYNLHGLTTVNVELTSLCNKKCWMCGRRETEIKYPELVQNWGHMDFELVQKIANQLPPNIIVQLHNNGEPLLYPRFGEAVKLFERQITGLDTNGKLLVEKADEIINNLDTITISIIENDSESEEQYKTIEEFFKLKGDKNPYVTFRLNGNVDSARYKKFNAPIARRAIHAKLASVNYESTPTIPEMGICLDFLNHLSINKDGEVSTCVRFDPAKLGVIGNVRTQTIEEIWNSEKRMRWLEYHKKGQRDKMPLCKNCHYWGVPTSGNYEEKIEKLDENDLVKELIDKKVRKKD